MTGNVTREESNGRITCNPCHRPIGRGDVYLALERVHLGGRTRILNAHPGHLVHGPVAAGSLAPSVTASGVSA
jgi:hypothetical protein